MNDQNTFITEAGLGKLKQELDELKGSRRKEIAERIQEAKELGDLSENAEYAEAKNEQSFAEGRILEIESIIKIRDDKETKEYFIVGSSEADPSKGRISNESPIGQAFIGKKVGDIIEINVPQGSKKFKIVTIA